MTLIRAPKLCTVPSLNMRHTCGDRAVGKCMVDCTWNVCAFHFESAKANGFCPETWEEKRARTIARAWSNRNTPAARRSPGGASQSPYSGCGVVPPAGVDTQGASDGEE